MHSYMIILCGELLRNLQHCIINNYFLLNVGKTKVNLFL